MEGLGLTELSGPKGRLDLGDQAALVPLYHRDCGLRSQSNLRKQGDDLVGRGMSYAQSLQMQTPLRKGSRGMDAR